MPLFLSPSATTHATERIYYVLTLTAATLVQRVKMSILA